MRKMCCYHNKWRHKLRAGYIKKTMSVGKHNKEAYEVYEGQITKEDWLKFVASSETSEFHELSEKNSENALMNKHTHLMGRWGYAKSIQKWQESGQINHFLPHSSTESTQSSEEIPRYVYWFCARTCLNEKNELVFSVNSEDMRGKKELLDKVQEDHAKGTWKPDGRHDILSTVVGKSDHPGRARGFGGVVGYSQVFGRAKRSKSQETSSLSEEQLEKIRAEIRSEYETPLKKEVDELKEMARQMQQSLAQIGIQGSNTFLSGGSPVSPGYRESGSSAAPNLASDFVDGAVCRLGLTKKSANEDDVVEIVAFAEVYKPNPDGKIHNIPMLDNHMRVNITMVNDGFDEWALPVTNDVADQFILSDAVGTFVQWPRDLIFLKGEEPPSFGKRSTTKGNKNAFVPKASPLEKETLARFPLSNKKFLNLLKEDVLELHEMFELLEPQHCQFSIPLSEKTFHYTSNDLETIINREDLSQFLSCDSLNVSILQGFLLYMSSRLKENGDENIKFLCPSICSHAHLTSDKNSTQAYLKRAMLKSFKSDLIFLPYNKFHHWTLIVICPHVRKGYIFDSASTTSTEIIKELTLSFKVASSVEGNGGGITFSKVKCRKQPGWVYRVWLLCYAVHV